MTRPAQALINLKALRHNYLLAKSIAPKANTMPVVKANAYGHGATRIAGALTDIAPAFAVACTEEAVELRQSGINQPILVLQGAFARDDLLEAAEQDFWVMVGNKAQLDTVIKAKLAAPIKIWLKIDTGMHRLGITPDAVTDYYKALRDSENVQQEIVLATHFACADDPDNDLTNRQIAAFKRATADIKAPASMANSPGLLGWESANADWNRPGFMLYGNSPFAQPHPLADQLKPVMTLKSGVTSLREVAAGETVGYGGSWRAQRPSLIATVTIGYGDGYPRQAENGTPVLINGQRAPLAGRVSMDMITVDVTDLPKVNLYDEVILWGDDVTANEVAGHAGTIGYEVLTRMPARTPRIYLD